MNLRKDNWEKLPLGEVCELYQPKTISGKDLIPDGKYNVWGANGIIGKFNEYNQEDEQVLISCRGEKCGVINYSEKQAWVTGNSMVAKPIEESKLDKRFLFFLLSGTDLSPVINGTAQPQITRKSIEVFKIPIPSPEEQKQIAALFQSIETAIEQVDGQEKNLRALRKKLMDGFCELDKSFTKAFKTTKWEKTIVDDIAFWYQRDIPNNKQDDEGIVNYIAADHIESDEILIDRHGTLLDGKKGPTITKHFRKGDFLLSTRSVAIHKAAVAHVDGVTGEKLIVIDVPESSKLLKGLLPYVMHSSRFWSYAKITASGSVNKFSSWNKIKLYEFYLPERQEQEKILEVFTQLETTLQQLKQQKTTLKNLKQKLLNEILG